MKITNQDYHNIVNQLCTKKKHKKKSCFHENNSFFKKKFLI